MESVVHSLTHPTLVTISDIQVLTDKIKEILPACSIFYCHLIDDEPAELHNVDDLRNLTDTERLAVVFLFLDPSLPKEDRRVLVATLTILESRFEGQEKFVNVAKKWAEARRYLGRPPSWRKAHRAMRPNKAEPFFSKIQRRFFKISLQISIIGTLIAFVPTIGSTWRIIAGFLTLLVLYFGSRLLWITTRASGGYVILVPFTSIEYRERQESKNRQLVTWLIAVGAVAVSALGVLIAMLVGK